MKREFEVTGVSASCGTYDVDFVGGAFSRRGEERMRGIRGQGQSAGVRARKVSSAGLSFGWGGDGEEPWKGFGFRRCWSARP